MLVYLMKELAFSRHRYFDSFFNKLCVWLFGFSSLLLIIYRGQRVFLGENLLALIPYWAFRDLATFLFAISFYLYAREYHDKRE